MTTTAPPLVAAPGPEIKEPTLTQSLMLDAPWSDDLCVISARGTGKSWGIALVVARDAAHFTTKYSCLITRTTFQGLTELQGLLWRYLTEAFPGTTYSSADMTFRLGGKDMPYGKLELAYTGAGPAEQVKALARLQGRSFICAIHDECGNHFDSTFVDMAAATLRGPAGVPTRTVLLGNPGGPAHPWLQARYGIPAGYPEPGKASRFWSEDLGKPRSLRASPLVRISTLILTNTSGISVLRRLMTRRYWMHGCMGGLMSIMRAHSLAAALGLGGA